MQSPDGILQGWLQRLEGMAAIDPRDNHWAMETDKTQKLRPRREREKIPVQLVICPAADNLHCLKSVYVYLLRWIC